jgi:hypothetical protein
MSLLDDEVLTPQPTVQDHPAVPSELIAITACDAIDCGGDLEAVLRAVLELGHLARTDLALAAISCRRHARANETHPAWRTAAVTLEAAARSGLFGSPERCPPLLDPTVAPELDGAGPAQVRF